MLTACNSAASKPCFDPARHEADLREVIGCVLGFKNAAHDRLADQIAGLFGDVHAPIHICLDSAEFGAGFQFQ